MPYRKTPLVIGQTYHIYNRSIARIPIFTDNKEYRRFYELVDFYSYEKPNLRFSYYNRLQNSEKEKFLSDLKFQNNKLIDILGYCFMPNHYHILATERIDNGIGSFISNIQNSYAKYFNIKKKRTGALFQSAFKAVRIEDDEQLVHVLRYIHLNPLTSYIISDKKALENYSFNSYKDYLEGNQRIIDSAFIKNYYKSLKDFAKFTLDQVDYQRKLDLIKHLLKE